MWKMLYMKWEFKGILRNPLYNNLNFPVKINVRSGVIPVSYTHLDVYKRQKYGCYP